MLARRVGKVAWGVRHLEALEAYTGVSLAGTLASHLRPSYAAALNEGVRLHLTLREDHLPQQPLREAQKAVQAFARNITQTRKESSAYLLLPRHADIQASGDGTRPEVKRRLHPQVVNHRTRNRRSGQRGTPVSPTRTSGLSPHGFDRGTAPCVPLRAVQSRSSRRDRTPGPSRGSVAPSATQYRRGVLHWTPGTAFAPPVVPLCGP